MTFEEWLDGYYDTKWWHGETGFTEEDLRAAWEAGGSKVASRGPGRPAPPPEERTMAARPDPIKDFVAEWIAGMLEEMKADAPAEVESIEVHRVGPRETVLRVKLGQGMPRYFTLKLTEPF